MKDEVSRKTAIFTKFVTMGKISAKILENLVEDVLDLAKIESGKFELNPDVFKIEDLIEEINYVFKFQCQNKGIEF